ncbi:SGNH/GDSL hydrolase family protein [Mesorhizobium sp. M0115]|uniref:SGNH/GDSL hydrolase family protein n=2 Tax=Mesorhizobium TaxID=68287 RepID=UPI00333DA419
MNVVKKQLWRARRTLRKGLIMLLGDRALLQIGFPGLIAKWAGCPTPLVRPNPYTLYELNPVWHSGNGRSRHNSLGFRGPETAMPKPEQCLRVVCMGESSTYCTGIEDDSRTYPHRLGEYLRDLKPGVEIDIVNAGVGGYTSVENVLRLLFHVAPLSPNLIVYYYTHNDVHPRRLEGLSRDYNQYSCSWFEPPSGGGLSGWFKRRQNLATAYVGNIVRRRGDGRRNSKHIAHNPPDAFRANFSALVVLAEAAGASVLFVNPNYRQEDPNDPAANAVWEHRRIVEDIAKRTGASVVDLHGSLPYLCQRSETLDRNYYDEVHFTEKGADSAARIVANAIMEQGLLNFSKEKPLIY